MTTEKKRLCQQICEEISTFQFLLFILKSKQNTELLMTEWLSAYLLRGNDKIKCAGAAFAANFCKRIQIELTSNVENFTASKFSLVSSFQVL